MSQILERTMERNMLWRFVILISIGLLNEAVAVKSQRIHFEETPEIPRNRILLSNCLQLTDDAIQDIRFVIVEMLHLPQLEYKILQAKHTDEGLLFEMHSKEDVQLIMDRSAILKRKRCSIGLYKELVADVVHPSVVLDSRKSQRIQYAETPETPSNRILLSNCFPLSDDAVEDIRSIIVEILHLPQLEYQILQAKHTDDGILFEMHSKEDVQLIMDRSAILKRKRCDIRKTTKSFIEIEIK